MDDGGRCLLDVINDPQLLQSFLENSNNNNQQHSTPTPVTTSSTTVSTTTTTSVIGGISSSCISPQIQQSSSQPQPLISTTSTIIAPKSAATELKGTVNTNNDDPNQMIITSTPTDPVTLLSSVPLTTTTTITKNPVSIPKKTNVRTRKPVAKKTVPQTKGKQQQFVHHSTTISTPATNTSGIPNTLNTAGPNGPTTLQIAGPGGTLIPLSIGGQNHLLTHGHQTIRTTGPSGTATTFVPTPFQLGPRPTQMAVLQPTQQFIQLPGSGAGGTPQFLIARPPLNPTATGNQIGGPGQAQFVASSNGQLLQIIQTSQGPQLVQTSMSTGTITARSAILSTASSLPSSVAVNTTTVTPNKGSKGKQLLPKIGSNKNNPKTNNSASMMTINSTANTANPTGNLITNTPTNIKLLQPTATSFVGGAHSTTFQTPPNVHQTPTTAQFLLSNTSGQPQQPTTGQFITGPNGTTFFVQNNPLTTTTGPTGGHQILFQPTASAPNAPSQPLQLAIRPQTPLFVTGPSSGDQTNLTINQLNKTGTNQSGLIGTFAPNTIRPPTTGQPGNQLILQRPSQLVGQQQQTAQPQPQPPQLIQIQTPNGPILLQLNSGQPQQQQQTAALAPPQPQPPTQQNQPQTIQIGNTVIQLAANANLQQTQRLQTGSSNSSTNHLPTTILTSAPSAPTHQTLETNKIIGNNLLSTSPLILNKSSLIAQQLPSTPTLISPTTKQQQKTTAPKGLNLADLLKETGILPDCSPPNSPPPSQTIVVPASLNQQKTIFDNSTTTTLVTTQLNQTLDSQQQQTILMVPQSGSGTNQILLPPPQPQQPPTSGPIQQQQQLRISLAPDGTIVLLSPNSHSLLAGGQGPTAVLSNNTTIQTNKTTSSTTVVDSSGLSSSQPSPDSTTPSIDAASTGSPQSQQQIEIDKTKTPTKEEKKLTNVATMSDTKLTPVVAQATTITSQNTSSLSSSNNVPPQTSSTTNSVLQLPTNPNTNNNSNTPLVLIPGTIMFLNEANNARLPSVAATLPRTIIPDLIEKLDQQLKSMVQMKQTTKQQNDLMMELLQLQKNLQSIQQQQLPLNQIPQLKISLQAQQLLQLNVNNIQIQTITTKPTPTMMTSCQQLPQHILPLSSSNKMASLSANQPTTAPGNQQPQTVQFVLQAPATPQGPKTQSINNDNSNSQQTMQLVTHASPGTTMAAMIATSNGPVTIPTTTTIDHKNQKILINGPETTTTTSIQTQPTTQQLIITKPKSNVVKAIQSQLHADQNAALHPDCRTPFRSRDDACKRLLRYHVFDQHIFNDEQMKKYDKLYENIARMLLWKKNKLYNKFRYLILQNSMKNAPTSEHVMVNRIMIDEETSALKADKEFVASGGVLDLPPIPESWLQTEKEQHHHQQQQTETDPVQMELDLELKNQIEQLQSESVMDGILNDSDTMKRKFDDVDIDEINFATSQLLPETEKIQQEDLNDMICDMFDDEQQESTKAITINENDQHNQEEDNGNVVDELIKQLDSPQTEPPTMMNGSDGFGVLLSDNNNQHFVDAEVSSENHVSSVGNDGFIRGSSNLEDDLALEALYTADSVCFTNQTQMMDWSTTTNHQHSLSSSRQSSMMNSMSHNHLMTGGGSTGSSNSWTLSRHHHHHHFGSINETEAAVAVQSIIGDDEHQTFESMLQNNHHERTSFDGGGRDIENQLLKDSIDEESSNSQLLIGNHQLQQTSADTEQMNCAIKSIMMTSSSIPSTCQQQTFQQNNRHAIMNNISSYQQGSTGYQQDYDLTSINEQMNNNGNFQMMFGTAHQTLSNTSTANISNTSMINDPMLDEAVKSIL